MADGRMAAKRHKKHKSAKANESIGLVARKRCAVRAASPKENRERMIFY